MSSTRGLPYPLLSSGWFERSGNNRCEVNIGRTDGPESPVGCYRIDDRAGVASLLHLASQGSAEELAAAYERGISEALADGFRPIDGIVEHFAAEEITRRMQVPQPTTHQGGPSPAGTAEEILFG